MHRIVLLSASTFFCWCSPVAAQNLDLERLFEDRNLGPVGSMLTKGDYELCARICEAAIRQGMKAPEWRVLRVRALMEMGQETIARDEVQLAIKTFPGHLELLMLQHDNARRIGRQDIADQALTAINAAARAKPAKERAPAEWVVLGQAALALGADASKVIEQYFAVAQKKDPKLEASYLAEGHLALEKDDAKRAADVFRAGLKAHGDTAELRAGLALAFAAGDRKTQAENIVRALAINPVHSGALLQRAELLIGAEKFLDAEGAIQKVLDVRDNCPEAWALRASIAHIGAADAGKAAEARVNGLKRWAQNPAVDHIIGRVLSRAYRFAEGASHQRQALAFDPGYLPAKVQLCHDLLRLGEEDEAWKLAAAVRADDGYNVQAHNIGKLEQEMGGYSTQSYEDFILKMPKREWPIYGERALALLREAKAVLCPQYGLELKRPVLVEFFGSQQDFAIRTFGSLGGQGLLGVCFGTVITLNSPGSLAHGRNNWESTLWHEFCHVVTLTVTKNRMPRWLSEGISVYEESRRNPAWGMSMNADFRKMILEDQAVTPISELSSAFLNAKSEEHLMFAYYQSSQAVSFLMERFGREKFGAILRDLAAGKRINEAIAVNTEPLDRLERDFEAHLTSLASTFGALADWKKPAPEEVNPLDAGSFAAFRKKHPANLWAIRKYGADMVAQENWQEAMAAADLLIQLLPEDVSAEGGYRLKAAALRKLNRIDEETAVLRLLADKDSSALVSCLRLLELDVARQNWPEVQKNAQRVFALNPFLRTAHQALAEASAAQGDTAAAIAAYRRLLHLEPANPAEIHFKLATLLRTTDAVAAKRHLLDALAFAPRFREGHELLQQWK